MREHEIEPTPGLPERLPAAERMLWQGAPSGPSLARSGFHLRWLIGYFAVMVSWTVLVAVADHQPMLVALAGIGRSLGLASVGVGLVALFAWATARSTLYTITDRRVVIRFGLALPMTVNLPFAQIEGVGVRGFADGTGDVVLRPTKGQRLAYMVMWPHTRPWQFARAQPMLRAVPDAAGVARLLSQAFGAAAGATMEPVAAGLPMGQAGPHEPVGGAAGVAPGLMGAGALAA